MSDITNFIEEDGVIIKQENKYASNDVITNNIDNYDNSDDRLKILPGYVEGIKFESDFINMGIKEEPSLDHDDEVHKQMDKTNVTEDDNNFVDNYDNLDDDPLKIMPGDIERIKSECDYENVEIKVEPGPDQGDEFHKEMNTTIEFNNLVSME